MKIYGIGFDAEHPENNYEHYFLEKISENIQGMGVANEIPADADVLLINLTPKIGMDLFGSKMPDENVYKIVVVHELYRTSLPFLKLADFVVYTTELQKRVCEELLGLEYNNTVMPLPGGDFEYTKPSEKACLVYFDLPLCDLHLEYFWENIDKAFCDVEHPGIKRFHFCIPVDSENEALFETVKAEGEAMDSRYCFHNSSKMSKKDFQELMKVCTHGTFHKREMDFEEFEEFMDERAGSLPHEHFLDSPVLADMLHCGLEMINIIEVTAYNAGKGLKATYAEWATFIEELVAKEYENSLVEKQGFLDDLEYDTLDDVIIEYGAPLSNKYVFSICFRNQEEKIQRCLESIKAQNSDLDFGVVLVNDCSEDKSIEKIIEVLDGSGVDACVVTNKKRNFAARNFYNVVHLYTTDDESVIIEVDGDDFLNGTEVLDILDRYYAAGALKTNGSYKMYPDGQDFMSEEDVQFNHKHMDYDHPWNLNLCGAWLHLRTSKRKLIRAVEINHFLDRNTHNWLSDRHDSALQPRIIELSEGKSVFVKEVIYNYDISGDNHDHDNEAANEEYLKLYGHLSKIYHPLILGE